MNRHDVRSGLRSRRAVPGVGACAAWLVAVADVATPFAAQNQKHIVGEWIHRPSDHVWTEGGNDFVPQFAAHIPDASYDNGLILLWLRTGGSPSGCTVTPYFVERLWDPDSGDFEDVGASGTDHASCSGYAPLPSGDIISVGGRGCPGTGTCSCASTQATLYSWASQSWTPLAEMFRGRFYPSAIALSTSKIFVMNGTNPPCTGVGCDWEGVPEIYDWSTDQWDLLVDAAHPLYPDEDVLWNTFPHLFQIPDGRIFLAGPDGQDTYLLDLATESWETLTEHAPFGTNGRTVMYRPGKVLKAGGSTSTLGDHGRSIYIDLEATNPVWDWIVEPDDVTNSQMEFPRRGHYLVLMPNGMIMAVAGFEDDPPVGVANAEWVDPDKFGQAEWDGWEPLAAKQLTAWNAGPHVLALLLRDGTVLVCGGEHGGADSHKAEIFEPPYLFDLNDEYAPRPIIDDAPEEVEYGQSFTITLGSQGVQEIEKVSLVRLGAPTHNFDQNQRFMWLQPADPEVEFIDQTQGELEIRAPSTRTHAPPGYYMLFVLTRDSGTNHLVPSEAVYIRLFTPCSPYDLNDDGTVNGLDLGILLADWGSCPEPPEECPSDFNGDGEVDGLDLGILLANWGLCEGSSGSSMSGGGGESMALAGGSGIDYDWILGADTIAALQEMHITELWAWYLTMVAQAAAAEQ